MHEENVEELDAGDNSGEYEVETIRDSAVYARESESGHLPGLYYLVSWKGYPEEENTWEPASVVQYLRSSSARSTRTTLTSRQRLLLQLTSHHRWLDQLSSPPSLSSGNKGDQQDALRSVSNEVIRKRQQGGIRVSYHLSPLSSNSLIIQVPHRPNHILLLSTNLGFSFPVLSPGWKVFSSTISTL